MKLKDVLVDVVIVAFMLDFEQAAWLAVRYVFEGVEIQGCVFHWTQAVWRQTQELGLKPAYSQRAYIYHYIGQLLGLPFLPHNHIEPTFRLLQRRANSEQLRRLVQCIDRQWLNHSIFDIPSWCIFGNVIHTNNDVEGWHHWLNNKAGHRGVSFYKLIPLLRREAELVNISVRLVADGKEEEMPAPPTNGWTKRFMNFGTSIQPEKLKLDCFCKF